MLRVLEKKWLDMFDVIVQPVSKNLSEIHFKNVFDLGKLAIYSQLQKTFQKSILQMYLISVNWRYTTDRFMWQKTMIYY